jgi:transposase
LDTSDGSPDTKTALTVLPELPAKFNPIKALPALEKAQLLDAVLSHYEAGKSIYEIAEHLGVNNGTIYRALLKHKPDEWKDVKAARYEAEAEDAEKELKHADTPVAVTRARERLANAKWMLERLARGIYGQDAPQDSAGRLSITLNIGAGQPLDVVAVHENAPSLVDENAQSKT